MFRIIVLAVFLSLASGCASNDHQAVSNKEAKAENDRLKMEAAALREAVVEQRATLGSLKNN